MKHRTFGHGGCCSESRKAEPLGRGAGMPKALSAGIFKLALVVAVQSCGKAACAWVLWTESHFSNPSRGPVSSANWEIIDSFSTAQACQQSIEHHPGAKATPLQTSFSRLIT